MADWVVISSIASAGGTLVLAGTTYASVRSANRAARMAELSLLVGLRPLLVQSSPGDPELHAGFFDGVELTIPGESAAVEVHDGRVYIGISLRNVGPGIGVLHGGYVHPGVRPSDFPHPPPEEFRMLSRDLYIPPAKIGFWEIAFREDDPGREEVLAAVERGTRFTIDLLYSDYEGGQRVVSRFGVIPGESGWTLSVFRHWQLDRADPR